MRCMHEVNTVPINCPNVKSRNGLRQNVWRTYPASCRTDLLFVRIGVYCRGQDNSVCIATFAKDLTTRISFLHLPLRPDKRSVLPSVLFSGCRGSFPEVKLTTHFYLVSVLKIHGVTRSLPGARGTVLVEALFYKTEGRGFESR
jgi:hypothetical protein